MEPVGTANPSFLEAARRHIIRAWRYQPATEDGVAVPSFLLGGDGYDMLVGVRTLISPTAGDLVVNAVEKYVTARRTVSPAIEGRMVLIR